MNGPLDHVAPVVVGVAMLAVAFLCALFALDEHDKGARGWAFFDLALAMLFFVGGTLLLEGF